MTNFNVPSYSTGNGALAKSYASYVRYMELYIDLTSDVTMTGDTDTVGVFQMPIGAVVLAGGLEQITAGSAGNTLQLRLGTVALSGTLASDAAAGTYAVHADVSGGAPLIVNGSADEVNILSAAGTRITGKIRVFIWFMEGRRVTGEPGLAIRDAIAGTA